MRPRRADGARSPPSCQCYLPAIAPSTVVLCTDGSDAAVRALAEAFPVLAEPSRVVVVTVIDLDDESLVAGTGFAGGVMSPDEYERLGRGREAEGARSAQQAVAALGIADAEIKVLRGPPGPAICDLAEEVSAAAIVMGSRGRGLVKRAVLGSVSDYVVRHGPCPAVISSGRGRSAGAPAEG